MSSELKIAISSKINASALQSTGQQVMQKKAVGVIQDMEVPESETEWETVPVQRKENKTGMPYQLKSGVESLSGMSMDHVKVHYNSSQPAQLNALAYAQGSDIHIAPGLEKHLPHEAWHVVQQAQGRVQPTRQMKAAVPVNDDPGLEREADVMGEKANSIGSEELRQHKLKDATTHHSAVQQQVGVVQFGGGPEPAKVGLINPQKITTIGDFAIYHGTKSDGYHYIEALTLEDKATVCAAYVQIVIIGDSVTLHTKADGKYQGGIGTTILPVAIYVVANRHVSAKSTVTLPMGGAAVIKLLVEKLSKTLGDPDIHSLADLKKTERKKKGNNTDMDPDVMDKGVAEEHKLHMQSLMQTEKGNQLSFTSYGRTVVEAADDEIDMDLDAYIEKITESPSQLFVDIPGTLFIEFAASFR